VIAQRRIIDAAAWNVCEVPARRRVESRAVDILAHELDRILDIDTGFADRRINEMNSLILGLVIRLDRIDPA